MAGRSAEMKSSSRRSEGADGAHVQLKAGDATSSKSTGGNIMLFAGHGTSNDRWDGGNGGSIELIAGGGHGWNKDKDTGGDISITGGASATSSGGSLVIKSGPSLESGSGNVTIATDSASKLGLSGIVNISTGMATWGDSGEILLSTGSAQKYGHGGNIWLEIGHTEDGHGGNVSIVAGPSSAMFCKSDVSILLSDRDHVLIIAHFVLFLAASGGTVIVQGGEGRHSSVRDGTDGGSVSVIGGKSHGLGIFDDGGSVNISAGASLRGDGGSIGIVSGSSQSKSSEFLENLYSRYISIAPLISANLLTLNIQVVI